MGQKARSRAETQGDVDRLKKLVEQQGRVLMATQELLAAAIDVVGEMPVLAAMRRRRAEAEERAAG